jgi:hypothetical protein
MARQLEHDRRGFHYVVALPRLFPEALDARDCDATRALVAWRRMSSFEAPTDQRAAAIRPRVSCSRPSLTLTSSWYVPRLRSSSGGGATRVTAPIRELIHNEERFRIAVFRSPAEAMWQGRPVVASGIAGLRSQVVDGETGILLDSLRLVRC